MSGWHASSVNKVQRSAEAFLEERLGLFRREYIGGYTGGGFRAFLIPNSSGMSRNGVSRVLGDISVPYAAGVLNMRWVVVAPFSSMLRRCFHRHQPPPFR
jgi:hypothetical protein